MSVIGSEDLAVQSGNTQSVACSICSDTGWVQAEADGVRGLRRCRCVLERIAARAKFDPAGKWPLPADLVGKKLSTFRLAGATDEGRAALAGAKAYAKRLPEDFTGGIVFSGPVGVGKSHLAAGILYAVDRAAHFANVATLMAQLRNSFNTESRSREPEVVAELIGVPVLVLDDLGAERVTGYSEEVLYRLIDARHAERRPTIMTTNRGIVEGQGSAQLVDQIGERSFDRIMGLCWREGALDAYAMTGESRRWGVA